MMENLLAKVHLLIYDTTDQNKEAPLTMENMTLVIDSVSNCILQVKENDARVIFSLCWLMFWRICIL